MNQQSEREQRFNVEIGRRSDRLVGAGVGVRHSELYGRVCLLDHNRKDSPGHLFLAIFGKDFGVCARDSKASGQVGRAGDM